MSKKSKLFVVLGFLSFALFNFPLLHIFNQDLCLGGTPLIIYYLFVTWLLVIITLWWGKRFLTS